MSLIYSQVLIKEMQSRGGDPAMKAGVGIVCVKRTQPATAGVKGREREP